MGAHKGHKKTGGRTKGTPNKDRTAPLRHVYEDLIGSMKTGRYYVYAHYCEGQCFYIGKGCNGRAWEKAGSKRNDEWFRYVTALDASGYTYDVRIVAANLSEDEAFTIECALIKCRKPLCNILHNTGDTSQMSIAL